MEAQLKVTSGAFAGHSVRLPRGKFLIGREPDCQCLLDDLSVSRHHCVLILDDWTLRIRDLGSMNGTFINRNRIGHWEIVLDDGDVISVGQWSARVSVGQNGASITQSARETSATRIFERDTDTQVGAAARKPSEVYFRRDS